MNGSWRRIALATTLCSLTGVLAAQEEAGPPAVEEAVENRLLRAELLEVSSGDLREAMEIYGAIHADESHPEPIRARALLYMARCHRKLGQLAEARRLLERIVESHASQREVLRQARAFLRELTTGQAADAQFDWLGELARNPEIQARVFDLAMDLAKPDDGARSQARRQLLALGPIAYPMLEKLIGTSRDPAHRQEIALVFLRQGRLDHLATLLDPAAAPGVLTDRGTWSAIEAIAAPGEPTRQAFLDALAGIPAEISDNPATRDWVTLMRLWAGDLDDLEAGLARIEANRRASSRIDDLLLWLIPRHEGVADVVADRLAADGIDFDFRRLYHHVLGQVSPESVGARQLEALITGAYEAGKLGRSDLNRWIGALETGRHFDVLARLAAGPARESVRRFYFERHAPNPPVDAAAGWARVLVEAAMIAQVRSLAETSDEAVPVFVELIAGLDRAPDDELARMRPAGEWTPSPAYRAAMGELLGSEGAIAQAVALEVLAIDPVEVDGPLVDRMLALASAGDLHVRELALYALIASAALVPDRHAEIVAAFAVEYDRRAAVDRLPVEYSKSPLAESRLIGSVSRWSRSVKGAAQPPLDTLTWIAARVGPSLDIVYPAVLDLAETGAGVELHEWLFTFTKPDRRGEIEKTLAARLDTLENGRLIESLIFNVARNLERSGVEAIRKLRRRVVADAAVSIDLRWNAWVAFGPPDFGWLDWVEVFRGGDPLAAKLEGSWTDHLWEWVAARPADERLAIYRAALESPIESIRVGSLAALPGDLPELRELCERALTDGSAAARSKAVRRLVGLGRTDVGPLIVGLLDDADSEVRRTAAWGLAKLRHAGAIEPLGKLLDDPNVDVREQALTALRDIRAALEERGEWKKLLEQLKPPADTTEPEQPGT